MRGSYITLKSLSEADDEEDVVAYYFPDSYKNVSGKKDDEKNEKSRTGRKRREMQINSMEMGRTCKMKSMF